MMMKINRKTFRTFSTLNELELLRKELKGQIHFTEELIKSDYNAIIADSRSLIAETVIRRGLLLSMKFLAKQLNKGWH